MLAWIILGVLLLFITLGFYFSHLHAKKKDYPFVINCDCGGGALFVCSLILLIVFLSVWMGVYLGHVGELAKMDSFQKATLSTYEYAVTETAAMLSQEGLAEAFLLDGSIEKLQLADSVSQRISELRTRLEVHNEGLARYQILENNILVGVFYPPSPDHLTYLTLKKE
ncbi:hypothetical protein LCGC14_1928210 [marine sediment metagenome]|uniref:Uncharacterized protein n=1 Tax=marine sediment metagenome TaxID=412755 RepID=A0A0F9I2M8_9ZZZZ